MVQATRFQRLIVLGGLAAGAFGLLLAGAAPAAARTSVGIGIGIPLYGPGYYAPPPYPYYGYPSPYYAPAYPPPPAYYGAPPDYGPGYPPPEPGSYGPPGDQGPPPDQNCRETRSVATVNGQRQWVYGTACQQPDGSWRNVQ